MINIGNGTTLVNSRIDCGNMSEEKVRNLKKAEALDELLKDDTDIEYFRSDIPIARSKLLKAELLGNADLIDYLKSQIDCDYTDLRTLKSRIQIMIKNDKYNRDILSKELKMYGLHISLRIDKKHRLPWLNPIHYKLMGINDLEGIKFGNLAPGRYGTIY